MSEEKNTERGRRDTPIRHPLAVVRAVSGLSQEQLARMLNVSRRTIQAVELGSLRLSSNLAHTAAKEAGVSAEWLLAGDPEKPAITSDGRPYTRDAFEAAQSKSMSARIAWQREVTENQVVEQFLRVLREARERCPDEYAQTIGTLDEMTRRLYAIVKFAEMEEQALEEKAQEQEG